ncbi:Permease for cytosine/purines, uracil, thiamine, allantoin, partial [mine drainage metagenome]
MAHRRLSDLKACHGGETLMASTSAQVVHADGRVELADSAHAAIADSRFYNRDLAPVPISKRTWNTYNYAALWVGM